MEVASLFPPCVELGPLRSAIEDRGGVALPFLLEAAVIIDDGAEGGMKLLAVAARHIGTWVALDGGAIMFVFWRWLR